MYGSAIGSPQGYSSPPWSNRCSQPSNSGLYCAGSARSTMAIKPCLGRRFQKSSAEESVAVDAVGEKHGKEIDDLKHREARRKLNPGDGTRKPGVGGRDALADQVAQSLGVPPPRVP